LASIVITFFAMPSGLSGVVQVSAMSRDTSVSDLKTLDRSDSRRFVIENDGPRPRPRSAAGDGRIRVAS